MELTSMHSEQRRVHNNRTSNPEHTKIGYGFFAKKRKIGYYRDTNFAPLA
ncbi:MAG: hypothetical protein ACOYUZ_00665 [Patescibacteria group bacterium]